ESFVNPLFTPKAFLQWERALGSLTCVSRSALRIFPYVDIRPESFPTVETEKLCSVHSIVDATTTWQWQMICQHITGQPIRALSRMQIRILSTDNKFQVTSENHRQITSLFHSGGLLSCEGFNKQLQFPWWGILFACVIALAFTLPVGVIQATTNQ
ncbi:hypothetical protein KI387_001070, partial [Taxus chinensis]